MERESRWIEEIQRNGSRRAADKLIRAYYDEIYFYAFRQTALKEDAMDLTQEIFIAALRSLNSFDPRKASFRTWLYRVASHKMIDWRRRQGPETLPIEEVELPEEDRELDAVGDRMLLRQIEARISSLERESAVVLLSPTLVRDRLRRTRQLQWSSRMGRRVLKTQILAAELSAFGLWIINLAAYGIPFLAQHPLIFQDFRLSQYSGHYIAMLLKAVPLFAALAWLCSKMIIQRAFLFGNPISELTGLPGAEFAAILILAVLSAALIVVACRQQRLREL